jgi:hypothetical protein
MALGDRGRVNEPLLQMADAGAADDPALAPLGLRIAKGWQVFWPLQTYRLPVTTCDQLTTFLFNNIPVFDG